MIHHPIAYIIGQIIGVGFLVAASYRWMIDGSSEKAKRAFIVGGSVITGNLLYAFILAPLIYGPV